MRSLFCGAWLIPLGCAASSGTATYQTITPQETRGTAAVREISERGFHAISRGDWESAEEAFWEALRADVSYASAHNNWSIRIARRRNKDGPQSDESRNSVSRS